MFKYIFGSLQVISVDEMKSAPASLKTELAMYIQALGELPEHGLMKMLDTDKYHGNPQPRPCCLYTSVAKRHVRYNLQ